MSDSTYSWNGGTGSASSPSNWTLENGTTNTPNVPDSDDYVTISSGDVQFVDTPLPGPSIGTFNGFVNWQGGEIDMINSGSAGGTAGVWATTTVDLMGTGSLTSSGTATLAGSIIADTGSSLSYTIQSGNANNTGKLEANGGNLTIQSTGGSFTNAGSTSSNPGSVNGYSDTGVEVDNNGSVLVTASLASGGFFGLGTGGTVEVNTAVPSGTVFDFLAGDNDTLKIDNINSFSGTIAFFDANDYVDFGAINVGTVAYDGTNLTLEGTAGNTIAVVAAPGMFSSNTYPVSTGTFTVQNDGTTSDGGMYFEHAGNGDEIFSTTPMACFAAGTRIATEHGEVAVEQLRVGDRVRSAITGKLEPIIWIGCRAIDCERHAQPRRVWPVRIAAGTFGRDAPTSDLYLSPDHALYVEDVLIPVKYLINGTSIAQMPASRVTYYHIQLAAHDVVLANSVPAESYLEGADRSVFANDRGAIALYPDLASRVWEAEGCAPLVVAGPQLEAARQRVMVADDARHSRERVKAA